PVVVDERAFAVHQSVGVDDPAAERRADALMAEAHAQERQPRPKAADHLDRDASVLRIARTRRDDDLSRSNVLDLVQGDLVIPPDDDLGAELRQVLVEVVRKAVVVVDQEQHQITPTGESSRSARSIAFMTARALFNVSWCSRSGSESATMPPPA